MKTRSIEIMQDSSEIVSYDRIGIPLYIRTSELSEFTGMQVACHWHEDLEWIHIIEGTLRYHVNDNELLLDKGDSLMVNSKQMHYGFSNMGQHCLFSCTLFSPSLLGNNARLQQQYVDPIITNQSLPYLLFSSQDNLGKQIGHYLCKIQQLKADHPDTHEFRVLQTILTLWNLLLEHYNDLMPIPNAQEKEDLHSQKAMVSYLYLHYSDKITLDEIASAGHVSRSKCCQIFKHYLKQSPIDFLNAYRLQVSCQLLRNTQHSITEIALSCGFHYLSYYSKLFLETYGITPREYRKKTTSSR